METNKNVGYNKKQKLQQSTNGSSHVTPKVTINAKKGTNSIDEGKSMFEWIINPMSVDEFME